MSFDIIKGFNQYFQMIPATDDPLKKEVYHLRYQVYCIETQFEDPALFEDELEIDIADLYSIHYLIKHNTKGYAATTRLVMPDFENLDRKFPIEEHCIIDNQALMDTIPRERLGEVSRFCVSKEFKQRKGEAGSLTGLSHDVNDYFSEDERRVFPHIALALIACLVRISCKHDIDYWYAVMEPSLLRFLKKLGIYFIPIGPMADYHGDRIPNVIKVSDLLNGVHQKNQQVWDLLTDRGRYLK